jgi:EF-hand domain-containing family member B
VEDFRGAHDLLGKGRKLNPYDAPRPYDTVYGKSSLRKGGKAPHSAADVMKGRYKEEDLQPDPDLGKSITPGFRNITNEVQ